MPSDRDLAQQWLAQLIHECFSRPGDEPDSWDLEKAAYILDTPGVEVGQTGGVVDWNTRPVKVAKRLVINLPWGAIEDEGSASAQPRSGPEEQS